MLPFYIDIETDTTGSEENPRIGLDPYLSKVVTLQYLKHGTIVPRIIKNPTNMDVLKPIFATHLIVGHNLKFDLKFLKQYFGLMAENIYDTYIAEILISKGMLTEKKGASLADLVKKYCNVELDKGEQLGFKINEELTPEQLQYAANDLIYLPIIREKQLELIEKMGLQEVLEIEMQALKAMVWLELSGVAVDIDKINEIRGPLEAIKAKELSFLQQELHAAHVQGTLRVRNPKKIAKKQLQLIAAQQSLATLSDPAVIKKVNQKIKGLNKEIIKLQAMQPINMEPINPGSTEQMLDALHQYGFHALECTDKEALSVYNEEEYPVLKSFSEYKKATKYLSTYVEGITKAIHPTTGRIHSSYRQIGAISGRLSSNSPNMQNQIHDFGWRSVFIAGPGNVFVIGDYSQIEIRIAGQLSMDEVYINAYKNGLDIYCITAIAIYHLPADYTRKEIGEERRSIAKAVTLAMNYGMTPAGLKAKIKVDTGLDITEEEAVQFIAEYQKLYPGAAKYFSEIEQRGLQQRQVRTLSGRICGFARPHTQAEKELIMRESRNIPIQGLSADITKLAMGRIYLLLEPLGIKFAITVHDEICLECPEGMATEVAEILKREMEAAGSRYLKDIPCIVDISIKKTWMKE